MENSIAFICCVNNEHLFNACLEHIKRLFVPEPYNVKVITLRKVKNIAAAYNAAMNNCRTKYKVYLHQDTFIINKNFIIDILNLFLDSRVGLVGVAGCELLPPSGIWWEGHNLYGKVLEFRPPVFNLLKFKETKNPYTEVQAIDGLIMTTQYDLPWREDIIKGFHFYDSSQSLEMIKAGYKVVIPYQKEPWVLHYCGNEFNAEYYNQHRMEFVREYSLKAKMF